MKKDLASIIQQNPGCRAVLDNDYWALYKAQPSNWEEVDQDEWLDDPENLLASSDDRFTHPRSLGYIEGSCYGVDILFALAKIVGVSLEPV